MKHVANPLLDQSDSARVHFLRADVRHAGVSQLRHPIKQHRAVWVAGNDQLRIAHAERADARALVCFQLDERQFAAQEKRNNRVAAGMVARAAVAVQIRASSIVEVVLLIVRVD